MAGQRARPSACAMQPACDPGIQAERGSIAPQRAGTSAATAGFVARELCFARCGCGTTAKEAIATIAADALPWATTSLCWKHRDFDRSCASSASAYVLARMRGDILSAHFLPGAKLYLKVLTARYNTSVAPVREALAVLSGAGLVISESQLGCITGNFIFHRYPGAVRQRSSISARSFTIASIDTGVSLCPLARIWRGLPEITKRSRTQLFDAT